MNLECGHGYIKLPEQIESIRDEEFKKGMHAAMQDLRAGMYIKEGIILKSQLKEKIKSVEGVIRLPQERGRLLDQIFSE